MKLHYFPQTSNNRKVLAVVHHLRLAPELEATAAYRLALARTVAGPERRLLLRRLAEVGDPDG